jgi:hypothetical protein
MKNKDLGAAAEPAEQAADAHMTVRRQPRRLGAPFGTAGRDIPQGPGLPVRSGSLCHQLALLSCHMVHRASPREQ